MEGKIWCRIAQVFGGILRFIIIIKKSTANRSRSGRLEPFD